MSMMSATDKLFGTTTLDEQQAALAVEVRDDWEPGGGRRSVSAASSMATAENVQRAWRARREARSRCSSASCRKRRCSAPARTRRSCTACVTLLSSFPSRTTPSSSRVSAAAAGSDGTGVIQAVKEAKDGGKNVFVIGVDSDQSHLARDFRRVGAASPTEYLARRAPAADALIYEADAR